MHIEDTSCASAHILPRVMNCPEGIKPDDWLAVRAAIGLLVRQLRGTNLHYHNVRGNNKDGLMHVFGLGPMAYGAMMLTAGVLKIRQAPGGNKDDTLLSINKGSWESIMAEDLITDSGKMTKYGRDRTHVRVAALREEVKELESKIKVDKYDAEKLEQKIKKCQEKKAKLKAKVASYHRKRKIDDDGIFQKMEKVLHKYKIYRGAYHGGDFQGPHLRRYMENAEAIFAEYLPIIKAANRPEGPERVMSDEDIDKFCADCVKLLQTIDAIHANLSKWYFDIEDEDTKKALQELNVLHRRALELVRKLGMSVTPKWTLEEDHVEDNHEWLIENGWGGEIWEDESYVEHEHQQGVKDNRRTQAMKSFRERESAQMKSSHRSSNQDVQDASLERKRKAKVRPGGQSSTKKQVKEDYRMEAATDGAAETDADGAPAII